MKRVLAGLEFIQALEAAGLVPENTMSVTIRAQADHFCTMDYQVVGDNRLLDLAGAMHVEEPKVPGE